MQNWFLENDMKRNLTKIIITSITHETRNINFNYNLCNNILSLHQYVEELGVLLEQHKGKKPETKNHTPDPQHICTTEVTMA
jgi:hypothetical protein